MKNIISFLPILLVLPWSTHSQITLIHFGSSWAYYDNQNEPRDQESINWYDVGYSTVWPTGNAHFGFGDSDEMTLLNPNARTAYFRKTITVNDPSSFNNLDLALIYDDGAVVFLNGIEVLRVNMPKRAKSYKTLARKASYDNSLATSQISNSLVAGNNVLAVQIHQWSASSSDISFDFKMTATAPGAVKITMGPIMYKTSPSSIAVKWETATGTESIVNYGTNQSDLKHSVSDLIAKTKHELRINGLVEDTIYFYEISNSATALIPAGNDIYFKTPPATRTSKLISAWVLNDNHRGRTETTSAFEIY